MSEDNTNQSKPLSLDDPAIKAAIQAEIEKATSGLIQNRDEILREKRELAEKLKQVDVEEYNRLKELAEKQENDKLKSNGNIDELVEKERSKLRADYEAKLKDLETQFKSAAESAEHYQKALYERTIADVIRDEAIKAGVLPEAINDVVSKGLGVFSLSNTGEVEARNSKGELLKDADDFVMTPTRYIQSLKKTNRYYWGASEGAGLSGSTATRRNDLNQQMIEAAAKGDMVTYRKLRQKQASTAE